MAFLRIAILRLQIFVRAFIRTYRITLSRTKVYENRLAFLLQRKYMQE